MEYSLRQAVDSDIDFLLNLRDITMGKYLKDCGMPRTKDAYLSRVLYEFEHAKIIEVEGSSAGLFKAKFNEGSNEWYLVQIQIHPNYQNQKIASSLISRLIDKANLTGSSVGLSVLKTNPAKHLYSRLGFVPVGENELEYLMQHKPNKAFKRDS
ncbi:histone acetyltransferase [Vibrio parahaemolyticus]|uniref:GNAT family N-acetyltransferase n=1 Tax=Vibrio parahaemolyticus TaxID=670 RepID=UPI00084A32BF|nr:GNAT family N-acetyltransferase [Vibrio parahaemolyticus]EGR1275243.1 N-acetyltransferase [Vibrio parahaemolyticus]ELA3127269.1 GNAT family N-acetyltransferase [Vibrio parahaemolyticus]MCG6438349.1 GNAT family N-acetyltransferase [Vibrio parahaemolyticus]OEA48016.1 histone acetyltransferase [Vibrio parahaemolyticus]TOE23615.1 N-acetyltransferase [Vibrio parahaemolyticus]